MYKVVNKFLENEVSVWEEDDVEDNVSVLKSYSVLEKEEDSEIDTKEDENVEEFGK